MRAKLSCFSAIFGVALTLPALFLVGDQPLVAADHFDPPGRVQEGVAAVPDIPADTADLYLFQTSASVVVSMDFGGPRPNSEPARYDRNVLYQIALSNAGTIFEEEFLIQWRFAQDPANPNAWGVQITGLPGNGTIVIPCETEFTTPNGIKIKAGLFDDPFNFDAAGLAETRATGRLSLRSDRNRFGNQNSTALVFDFPIDLIRNGNNRVTAWGFTYRFPGTTPS